MDRQRSAILLFVLLSGCICVCRCDGQFRKSANHEWHCDYICIGSGGRADYNPKTNVCLCRLPNSIDDADVELMIKNARNVQLNLLAFVPTSNKIVKRDTTANSGNKLDDEVEPIVGQQPPARLLPRTTTRPRLTPFTFTTRRPLTTLRPLRTTTPQRGLLRTTVRPDRLHEIQDRLNRMREERRNRARPQMGPRSAFGSTERPSVLDQIRERQHQRRERINTAPRVGGTQATSETPTTTTEKATTPGADSVVAEAKPNFPIITQSPDLIDGDN